MLSTAVRMTRVSANAYHRMLYLFICTNGPCVTAAIASKKPACKLIRQQLPEDNELYVEAPDDPTDPDGLDDSFLIKPGSKRAPLCRVSGLFGRYSCSRCHKVHYASSEFQAIDWKFRHKFECPLLVEGKAVTLSDASKSVTFDAKAFERECAFFREFSIATEQSAATSQSNPAENEDDRSSSFPYIVSQ